MSRYAKIILFNVAVFFFGWTVIFLAGADRPPPVGFLWLDAMRKDGL